MKAALRPEDAADLNPPWQLHQPVDLEDVIHRQVRPALVKIRAVEKRAGLRDNLAVSSCERAVLVGLACTGLGHCRHYSNETVGGQRKNTELIVRGVGESIVPAQEEAAAEPPIKV